MHNTKLVSIFINLPVSLQRFMVLYNLRRSICNNLIKLFIEPPSLSVTSACTVQTLNNDCFNRKSYIHNFKHAVHTDTNYFKTLNGKYMDY